MISFLNLIFIKGENLHVLNNNNYFNDNNSFVLNITKEKYKEIIKNTEFTLSLIINNKNKFQIQVDYLPLDYGIKNSFELEMEKNLSFRKIINIKTIMIDGTESNLNPEQITNNQHMLTNNKKIEIEFSDNYKIILSNENLEATDPTTNQKKQFNGYLKHIFQNNKFILLNLRELIMFERGMIKKEELTEISTLDNNNDVLNQSKLSLLNNSLSKNKPANLLNNVHQNPSHMNYYFLIIPTVVILVICLSVFLFWLKK